MTKLIFILRLVIAIIYLQTLYFKFSGAEESKYIFTMLKMEPEGRIISGILELIISIFILFPKTYLIGSFISLGMISGAIFSHLFILGIEIQNDSGLLFTLAIIIFLCSLLILIIQRKEFINLIKRIKHEVSNFI